jgi:hypothetical protein
VEVTRIIVPLHTPAAPERFSGLNSRVFVLPSFALQDTGEHQLAAGMTLRFWVNVFFLHTRIPHQAAWPECHAGRAQQLKVT